MYQLPQREIEFRAWDWDRDENKMFSLLDFFQWNRYSSMLYASDELVWKWNIHFMQYTWLKDKHKQKIFEGDILRLETDYKKSEDRLIEKWSYIVSYIGAWFWLYRDEWWRQLDDFSYIFASMDIEYIWVIDSVEVIGNVFEHPDLIPTPQWE